jgi:hypothetical protein
MVDAEAQESNFLTLSRSSFSKIFSLAVVAVVEATLEVEEVLRRET